jgi:hypothetical protein
MNISMITNKIGMKTLFLFLFSMIAFIVPLQRLAAQQQYPVQIHPTVSFPSTMLNDYADPANTNIRVYLADLSKHNYTINIRISLTSTGVSYNSIQGINVTLDGGQVYFLNGNELSRLFALTDLTVIATAQTNEPNSLPEGGYSLALEAFDASLLPTPVPVSNIRTDFTLFNVVRYDPPLLNSPANKQEFDLQTTNQNIFFNWTPRSVSYSPNQHIQYRYRMIRVIPVDRNPYDAVNTSVAGNTGNIDVNALDFATFIYSPTDLPLIPGSVYAWQVQAYEMINGTVSTSRFKNQGFSEVFTFSIKENCAQITLVPPVITGNSINFTWNPGDAGSIYNEYEFNYRPVGSTTGWIPISTTNNSIELDNTVLQTGIAYEYNVRARCNNWLIPVQGSNFTLATPTCVAPTPITVATTTSATTLSWTKAVSVDSLKLYYKITGSADPYSTLLLNPGDVQCNLPPLTSGGYTIHLDALCGTNQTEGVTNDFAYDEKGIVGPCPIPLPFQLVATRIKGDTASLKWNTIDGTHTGSSITYWHKDSSTVTYNYNSVTTSSGTGAIGIHVYDDQVYSYQINYLCGTKSQITPIGMFRILSASAQVNIDPPTANCFPPVDIRAEARDSVTARVEWDKISGADTYELSYRVKGSGAPFLTFNTTATNATLKPLQSNAQYQLLVRVKCSGVFSIYSDTALVDLTVARNRNCDTVTFFTALNKTINNIQTAWNYDNTCTGYIIKYREEAQPLASEYTQAFTNMDSLRNNNVVLDTVRYTFQNLKSGTKYVFRIQKICGQDNALFNLPLVVTTLADAKSSGGCGGGNVCNKDSTTKLKSMVVGDTIYCADYQVVVDSVTTGTSNPSMGIYSGLGHMEMPVPGLGDFVNMHVSFKNVKINDKPNSCVYGGVINIDSMNASIIPTAIRDSVKALMAKAEGLIDEANAALAEAQGVIDKLQAGLQQGIDYFQGGDGVGNVVTGKLGDQPINTDISVPPPSATVSGNTITVGGVSTAVSSFPALLKDTDGEVFQVTSTGLLTYVGKYDTTYAKDTTLDLSDQIVTYTEFSGATYDFDAWNSIYTPSEQINREYEKIGTSYYVSAKFITPGALDKVTATINTSNSDAQKVVFSNGTGFVYDAQRSGKEFTLNLAGGPASDGQYIYAWYVDGTTRKAIGKLLLPSYAPKAQNVVLIPVKGAQTFNPATYETYLNQTYQKIGITYHVTLDESFRTNTDWATDGNLTVQSSASGLLSNDYQGKEKDIIAAYVAFKGAANIDSTKAYFMVVYEPSLIKDGATTLLGKMPAEEQFGFLYSGSFSAAGSAQDDGLKRTMAHELGHGAYHMDHTFNTIYLGTSSNGTTANLMDYSAGNELWKFQWDIVQAPGHVWGILKKDKDAQMLSVNGRTLQELGINETGDINFVRPDGTTITFDASKLTSISFSQEYVFVGTNALSVVSRNSTGVLSTFTYDGVSYKSALSNLDFRGYYPTNSRDNNGYLLTSKRLDKDNSNYLKNAAKTVKVYVGVETETCQLDVKSGTYNSSYVTNAQICKAITLQSPTLIKSISLTTECLEWFDEATLNPLALKWWTAAKTNSQYTANENTCRRITRLLNDLEAECPSADKSHLNELFDIVVVNEILKTYSQYTPKTVDPSIAFVETKLRAYENYIRIYSEALKNVDETFDAISNNDDLFDVLVTLPVSHYSGISYAQRLKAIKSLCQNNLTEYFIFGSNTELVVLDLLKTTPDTDVDQLLPDLIDPANQITNPANSNVLFPHLLAKLYDGFDGDNFVDFSSKLLGWILTTYPNDLGTLLTSSVNGNDLVVFNPGTWTGHVLVKDFTTNGNIYLNLRQQFSLNIQDLTVSPYTYVKIKFKDTFKYGNGKTLTFNKGAVISLPACFVFSIFNEENNQKIIAGTKLAVDVGLCLLGVGEIRLALQAATTARKIYLTSKAVADLTLALSDIVINDLMLESIQGLEGGEEFLTNWNTFQLYYGVGSLTASGLDALVRKLYANADQLKQLDNVTSDIQSKLDDITDKIEDETGIIKTVLSIDELVASLRARLVTRIANESGMTLRYTDDELKNIIQNGNSLGLPEKEIEDIIFNGCRNDKAFLASEIISQTNYWSIVRSRGYPNLFASLEDYGQFSTTIKNITTEWNLPANSIFVQGSTLRVQDASLIGDIDVAIRVDAATFDNLLTRFKNATTSTGRLTTITNEAVKGKISGGNMFLDTSTNGSFKGKIMDALESLYGKTFTEKFNVPDLQISIIKEDSARC